MMAPHGEESVRSIKDVITLSSQTGGTLVSFFYAFIFSYMILMGPQAELTLARHYALLETQNESAEDQYYWQESQTFCFIFKYFCFKRLCFLRFCRKHIQKYFKNDKTIEVVNHYERMIQCLNNHLSLQGVANINFDNKKNI